MPVYIVDKPLGLSSHDVVAKVRKRLNTRKVGHAGTLDPLATGVLVLLVEEASKLSPFLSSSDKAYLAWVSFGAGTPTLDAEGPVAETGDASGLTRDMIEDALAPFLKLERQVPPQYAAIKKGGIKGYEAARRGETLALEARPAGYQRTQLLAFAASRSALPNTFGPLNERWGVVSSGMSFSLPPTLGHFPTALFYVEVQAGTYIRAFARDLGAALGVPAHLSGLVRTRAGRSRLEHSHALETLSENDGLPMTATLSYPLLTLTDQQVTRVRQGQRLSLLLEARTGLVTETGELVAIAETLDGRMRLLRVWT